jgi:hypothetical protein
MSTPDNPNPPTPTSTTTATATTASPNATAAAPALPNVRLRDLPIAARLVLLIFLISVGCGYFSALVQLHFQHASLGNAMPTLDDVVEHFAGVKYFWSGPPEPTAVEEEDPEDREANRPKCDLERLIMAPTTLPQNRSGSMANAFFEWCSTYKKEVRRGNKDEIHPQREAERTVIVAWINSPEEVRKQAYTEDKFVIPEPMRGLPVTEDYVIEDETTKTKCLKVKDLMIARCSSCHEGGKAGFDAESWESISKFLQVPQTQKVEKSPLDGEQPRYVRSDRQINVERLAQSTHVHALGFSMLYLATGLIFALTSYPGWLRVLLAPLPLVAQFCDISCWWLARLDEVGPYFATAIVFTGGIVGASLGLQILLTIFNLFGRFGKLLLVLLCAAGLAGFGVLGVTVLKPLLEEEKARVQEAKQREIDEAKKKREDRKKARENARKLEEEAAKKAAEQAKAEKQRQEELERQREEAEQALNDKIKSAIDTELKKATEAFKLELDKLRTDSAKKSEATIQTALERAEANLLKKSLDSFKLELDRVRQDVEKKAADQLKAAINQTEKAQADLIRSRLSELLKDRDADLLRRVRDEIDRALKDRQPPQPPQPPQPSPPPPPAKQE